MLAGEARRPGRRTGRASAGLVDHLEPSRVSGPVAATISSGVDQPHRSAAIWFA